MAVLLSPVGGAAAQFLDNNGNPLLAGKLYTYVAGTTTNQVVYTSSSGVTPHTNPIILDAGGRVPGGEIWLTDGLQYKFVLKNANDVLIGTYDNLVGINSNFVNFLTETEVQTATAGQTVFTLTTMQYQQDTNNLSVFVDGVNQIDGATYSYVETSPTVVTFTTGLHVGALVKFTTAQTLSTGVTDASLVTYTPAGTGAVATNVQAKLRETVSVLDFGADPTGTVDSTAAFNLATLATQVHTGNDDLDICREIYIPAGDYLIDGTVYVRKRQHLRGAGNGSVRIVFSGTPSLGTRTFVMGSGLINGVETVDPGGLPCVISDFGTFGGDATGAVIDCTGTSFFVYNMFMTSAGTAIKLGGGDNIITNCAFDQGLTGITITGQNHIIGDCQFYLMTNGIRILDLTYDSQINNCHFEYGTISDINFALGATSIQNISVSACQFLQNAYNASMTGCNIAASSVTAIFSDCSFRNASNTSLQTSAGSGSDISVFNCVFDGAKTNPVYSQSTTAAGINTFNSGWVIKGCVFKNLKAGCIAVPSVTGAKTVRIEQSTYFDNTGTSSFVNITGTSGQVDIYDCLSNSSLPVVNTQSNIPVTVRNNNTLSGTLPAITGLGGTATLLMPNAIGAAGGGQLILAGRSFLAITSAVAGLYLITGSTGSIITVSAIVDVAVTYNLAAKTITITNNAADQLDVSYFLTYI